jgi:two-component system, chemotaxis family, chemotaxis protein CheY
MGHTARVLVIDDEPFLRRVARALLEGAGHEVEEAADGAEGLGRYCARPAGVVVCDLFMPGVAGLEAIRELARLGARVVAISGGGHGGADLLDVTLAAGACAALAKPFTRAQLLGAVEAARQGASGSSEASVTPVATTR